MLAFRGGALIVLHGGTIGGLPEGFVSIGARWMPNWFGFTLDHRDVVTLLFGLLAVVGLLSAQLRARAKVKSRGLVAESMNVFWARNGISAAAILFATYKIAGHRGMPYILLLLSVLVVAYIFVLSRTVFGRHIYAMGGNRFAAMMSGVKTKWVDFFIFVNIGALTGIAAVVTTARAAGAVAGAGDFYELDAIAACFIGGAAVSGGVGKISGAVTGAFLIGVLNQGLSIAGVDPAWQKVIKGLVLIAAVAFDTMNRRRAGTN